MDSLKPYEAKPENPYFRAIWNRLHNYNYNHMQANVGDPGSGKSWCAITQACMIDPTFNIDKVVFKGSDFLKAIRDIKYTGEILVFDELGVALSSRKWHSLMNMLINEVIQTFRYKRVGVIFTVPDISYIDVQARKVLQNFCIAKRSRKDPTMLWVYNISHNRKKTEDPYFIAPRTIENGVPVIKPGIVFKSLPPKDIREAYEEKQKEFKEGLSQKNKKILEMLEEEDKPKSMAIEEQILEVVNNKEGYSDTKGTLNTHIIQTKLGCSRNVAFQIKTMADLSLSSDKSIEYKENVEINNKIKNNKQ